MAAAEREITVTESENDEFWGWGRGGDDGTGRTTIRIKHEQDEDDVWRVNGRRSRGAGRAAGRTGDGLRGQRLCPAGRCRQAAGRHGGRLPAVGSLALGRVAGLAAGNAAATSARRLGAPLPLGRPAGGGGRAAGRRGRVAAAASREVAEPRRRLRAAGYGAAAAPDRRPARFGALGFLQGGRPAAVAGPRAAGGGSEGGRRHVPADDARHPAAVRRLQEVRLRPAARPLHAGGTQLGGAAFEPRPELSHLEAPLRLGMLSAQPYLCGPTPEQYRKAAGGGRRLWRWPPAPSGGWKPVRPLRRRDCNACLRLRPPPHWCCGEARFWLAVLCETLSACGGTGGTSPKGEVLLLLDGTQRKSVYT